MQPRLQFDCLFAPVRAKGVIPFSLPLFDLIARVRPRIPPLEFHQLKEKMVKDFPLVVTVLTMIVFLDSFPQIQDRCHWFTLVEIRVSVAKYDVNDGFYLSIP